MLRHSIAEHYCYSRQSVIELYSDCLLKIIIGMSLYLFPDEILPDGREGPEMAEKFSDFLSVGGE